MFGLTIWIVGTFIAIPVVVILSGSRNQPWYRDRHAWKFVGILLPIGIALLVCSRMNGVRVEGDLATVTAFGFHHAQVPASRLTHPDQVIASTDEWGEWRPTMRLHGLWIFAYHGGWFRLCNGDRGFLVVDGSGPMLVYRDAVASGGSLVISEHYVTSIGLAIETNASAATP